MLLWRTERRIDWFPRPNQSSRIRYSCIWAVFPRVGLRRGIQLPFLSVFRAGLGFPPSSVAKALSSSLSTPSWVFQNTNRPPIKSTNKHRLLRSHRASVRLLRQNADLKFCREIVGDSTFITHMVWRRVIRLPSNWLKIEGKGLSVGLLFALSPFSQFRGLWVQPPSPLQI